MSRPPSGAAVLAVNAAAGAVVLLAAAAAGSERTVADQYGAVQLAALGLIAALAADVVAVLQGRRRLALRRQGLRAGPSQLALLHRPVPVTPLPDLTAGEFVALPSGVRYHRSGCALVAGRDAAAAAPEAHHRADRRPCGVCRP